MTTEVDVCNLALGALGSRAKIASLTENSQEARYCNTYYAQSRDAVLEEIDWPFAAQQQSLALLEENPTQDWGYSYGMPNNCLKARKIVQVDRMANPVPFTIAANAALSSKIIMTDQKDAILRYTGKITVPNMFAPSFVAAMAAKLAAFIAMPITRNIKIADSMGKQYLIAIRVAAASALNEVQSDEPDDADWIKAREE